MFYLPHEVKNYYTMDRIFFIIVNVTFWYSTAFLLNAIINKFFWGGIKKVAVGDFFLLKVKDFVSMFLYITATLIVVVGVFHVEFTFNLFSVSVITLLLSTFVRSHILAFFKSVFLSNTQNFNMGDWVKLIGTKTNLEIVGEIEDIDRKTLKIKTEGNNIVIIPQESLNEFVIQNYWGSGKQSRFEVRINVDSSIPAERVKRILAAGAIDAVKRNSFLSEEKPEVLIKKVDENGTEYSILFWIEPWEKFSPQWAKDKILQGVLSHLSHAGIYLINRKGSSMSENFDGKENTKNILSKIELFSKLNDNELELLSCKLEVREFAESEKIITQGDEGASMFILVEGLLKASILADNGSEIEVGQLSPGDFFGEMTLFTGEKRTATIECECDSLVYEIKKEDLSPIIENRKEIIYEFGETILDRKDINYMRKEEFEKPKGTRLEQLIGKIRNFFVK
jgi:small-conductance mechanosensitive channel